MTVRGTISSWDSGTWTANIRIVGSAAQALTAVPVNRGIASADMVTGRTVVVDLGSTREEAVVLAVVG